MATRNLYEIPDVCAALLTAITTHNATLTHKAAQELYVSGIDPTPFLLQGWLLSPPRPHIDRLVYDSLDTVEQLVAAVQEIPAFTCSNLPIEHPALPTPLAQGQTTWPLPWSTEVNARFQRAVEYALKKKNHTHAAYLASNLTPHQAALLLAHLGLKNKYTILFETQKAPHLLQHGFAILVSTDASVRRTVKLVNGGRSFSIPAAAYKAWDVQPKPQSRLQGLPLHICDEDACPFWKTAVLHYKLYRKGTRLVFPDDATLEAFYEENFPQDIPDEWSIAERAKSHPIMNS